MKIVSIPRACSGAAILLIAVLLTLTASAAELDDKIDLGGFTPNMTIAEADRLAGSEGVRECNTWRDNPTIHWCKWTHQDDRQHV